MKDKRSLISVLSILAAAVLVAVIGRAWLALSVPGQVGTLSVTMLDVGNADCFLIRQDAHAMLIDGGGPDTAASVVQTLQNKGVDSLDLVVITHPHADHIGGLPAVFGAITVKQVLFQAVPDALTPDTPSYAALQAALRAIRDRTEIVDVTDGGTFSFGTAELTVFPVYGSYEELNDYSIVCRITHGLRSFLFMGDAEGAEEARLLESGEPLTADLLKVGHHGSRSSTGRAFLQKVSPSIALISCGENDYGHPHEQVLDALTSRRITILRSDRLGMVTVTSDGYLLQIEEAADAALPDAA